MTIRVDEGTYWVECNACGDCHDLKAETHARAVQELGDAGWRGIRTEDGWEHCCPGCFSGEETAQASDGDSVLRA